ncbi:MAG: DUF1887 family protein [Nitrospirae bacterium]|nr:DUF1887 family protein [Nitrospirota bacterium]
MKIHVCLVSAQPIPNLIPLRMDELSPEKVILLESKDVKAQAQRIEQVIKTWGIKVVRCPIEPYDLESARETCLNILAEIDKDEVTLNVTGGTKIMALAAFEVFREMKRPIIYVDTQNRNIQTLSPAQKELKFKGVIKVKPYLAVYGQDIVGENTFLDIVKKHRPMMQRLIKDIAIFEPVISVWNTVYAVPARNTKRYPFHIDIESGHTSWKAFGKLTDLFETGGIVQLADGKLIFPTEVDTMFASGDWLSEFVFDTVLNLSVTDVHMEVDVKWDRKGHEPTTNNYDVVFTCNNQLYLIECKTKHFEGKEKEGSNTDLIYKLDSLKEATGGLYGKGMLVSYRKLTNAQISRLEANGLKYCHGVGLKNLADKIKEWIR